MGISRNLLIFPDGGARWIVDYKSSEPTDGESIESFMSREMELYAPQLRRYQGVMETMGETNIKTAIFFTNLGLLKAFN